MLKPEVSDQVGNLQDVANRIRKEPRLVQTMDVSLLLQEAVGRWRQYADLLEASEEVPVAAWIVRRKVEGLVRPDEPAPEPIAFDPASRASWPSRAAEMLQLQQIRAGRFVPRAGQPPVWTRPAPVKDANVWKLVWSFPRLRPRREVSVALVERKTASLRDHMQFWETRLNQQQRIVFEDEMGDLPRREWAGYFLAVVHLWHQQSVRIIQTKAFDHLILEQPVK
ncbi:MAG: hypothetical protein C7B45_05080 [Sulfobacillus acidophilus]|uniref:Segregation and condensation protein A n=1 Tax=Sulfobacillus acidophilus TaxID=53633 RepID=A0A2T2WKV7_9FIRM|nr:MAG: hypothetical protein C7B45_05080 [Sulfobacillus acidophilus]